MRKAAEIVQNQSKPDLPAIFSPSGRRWQCSAAPAGPLEVFELNYLHYHDTLELGLCLSGQGVCRVGDREFPFEAGDVQIIFPFQRHLSKSVGESSLWYWLNLDPLPLLSSWNPSAAPAAEEAFTRQMGLYGILKPAEFSCLAELVTRILCASYDPAVLPEHREDYLSASLYLLILELYRVSLPLPKLTLQPERRFMALKPALAAIDAAVFSGEALSMPKLSALCGMSEATFFRAFRESIGQAPSSYIAACRLKRAQHELVFSDKSILEVALAAGFGDPSGLYRCFMSRCGISPSAYRQAFRHIEPK